MSKLTIVLAIFLMSCNVANDWREEIDKSPKDSVNSVNTPVGMLTVAEINGCEYVIYSWGAAGGIVHSGSCNNHDKSFQMDTGFLIKGHNIIHYTDSANGSYQP